MSLAVKTVRHPVLHDSQIFVQNTLLVSLIKLKRVKQLDIRVTVTYSILYKSVGWCVQAFD